MPLAPGRDALCGAVRIAFTPVGHLLGAIIGAMILLGIYRMVAKPDHGRRGKAHV